MTGLINTLLATLSALFLPQAEIPPGPEQAPVEKLSVILTEHEQNDPELCCSYQ